VLRFAHRRRSDLAEDIGTAPEEQAVLTALAALHEDRAPASLRVRIQLMTTLARRPRAELRRRRALATAAAGLAAAALAASAVILTGSAAAPSLADAVTLATKPAATRVPEPPGGRVTLPRVSGSGLAFPYLEDRFGWKATGMRRDRLGGRTLITVLYARGGRMLAYTIVSGPPLEQAGPARATPRAGTRLSSLSLAGRNVVIWLRQGHTCVLSGQRVSTTELLDLGAWRAHGALAY
jgi:hypothetical protein